MRAITYKIEITGDTAVISRSGRTLARMRGVTVEWERPTVFSFNPSDGKHCIISSGQLVFKISGDQVPRRRHTKKRRRK